MIAILTSSWFAFLLFIYTANFVNLNGQVIADLKGDNSVNIRYLRGDQVDQLFGRVDKVGTTARAMFYFTDRQGSVVDIVTSAGEFARHILYDGLGYQTTKWTDPTLTLPNFYDVYGYTGRELDPYLKLQYNRARFYDPDVGRWISPDPLGYAAGDANLYRYVSGNPVNFTDPSGYFLNLIAAGVGAAVGGLIAGGVTLLEGGSWEEAGQSALKGALVGAVIGLTGGAAAFAMGGLVGAAGGGAVATAIVGGMVGAAVGNFAGQVAGWEYDQLAGGKNQGKSFGEVFSAKEMLTAAATGGILGGLGAGLNRVMGGTMNACNATGGQVARQIATNGLLGGGMGLAGDAVSQGIGLLTGQQTEWQWNRFWQAGVQGAITSMATSAAQRAYLAACFTAGTKLMARGPWGEGWRAIELLTTSDEVLSRDEHDPRGPLVWKKIEEVFRRVGFVDNLHVGDKIIGTSAEHPFYVEGKNWRPANELTQGDRLPGLDPNLTTPVTGYAPSGKIETLYNIRVADYHTYFVGGEDWGFSVWAHNAYNQQRTAYGSDELSAIALDARRSGRLLRRQNAVVAEYTDQTGNLQQKLFKNVQGDPQLGRMGIHAERVMDAWFQKKGISPDQVSRIYSEYYPCTKGCRDLLGSTYSNSPLTWSFTYDQPGGPYTTLGRAFRGRLFDSLGLS